MYNVSDTCVNTQTKNNAIKDKMKSYFVTSCHVFKGFIITQTSTKKKKTLLG